MKRIMFACLISIAVLIIGCAESSESKVYTHTEARFSVTCQAGWSLISEDSEMYEFRRGDVKLIEVGGFVFGSAEYFVDVSDTEFKEFLKEASFDGLDGYCEEAEIRDWSISEQDHMTWGGLPGYRIHATGFSDAADVNMVMDLIAAVNLETDMLYMFVSQIAENQFTATKSDVEATIQSFKVN